MDLYIICYNVTMELLEIAVVGIALSGVVELIKAKFGTKGVTTKALTLGLAVILGGCIFFLSGTPMWQSVLGVLGMASTVYAYLIK